MTRPPPISTRTDTLFPDTTRFRSAADPRRIGRRLGSHEPHRRADGRRHAHRAAALHVRHPGCLSSDAAPSREARSPTRSTLKEKTMKHLMLTTMLGVTALLAACGQKTESNETTAANSATEAASNRSEEHTSELQSLMRNSYALIFLQQKRKHN